MAVEIEYGELTGIESCQVSLSHGITPDAFSIVTHQPPILSSPVNSLRLTDLDRGRSIRFFDVAVTDVAVTTQRGYTWTLQLLDRRWKWRFGEISGWYNRRLPDGELDPEWERTPRQLAEILLQEMGEAGYVIDELPDVRPEVRWEHVAPASELLSLVEPLGMRITLGLDNWVRIKQRHQGFELPEAFAESLNQRLSGEAAPDAVRIYSAPKETQRRVELEAVGYDHENKSIVPINQLPYRPDATLEFGGWTGSTVPSNQLPASASDDDRKWADEAIWKWYRIKGDQNGQIDGHPVKEYEFLGRLIEQETQSDGSKANLPARIYGRYNNLKGLIKTEVGRYEGSINFDPEDRIFRLGDRLWMDRKADSPKEFDPVPAELFGELTMIWAPDGERERVKFDKDLANDFDTKPMVSFQDTAVPTRRLIYDNANPGSSTGETDNISEIEQELEFYADRLDESLKSVEGQQGHYIGLLKIEPDGSIEQVSWNISERGITTSASTGGEHLVYDVSYQEKLELEDRIKSIEDRRRNKEISRLQDQGFKRNRSLGFL